MKQLLGFSINTIENIFLTGAVFFLVLYLITMIIQNKPTWFLSANIRQCLNMEQKFQKLVSSRKDTVHHYYWAKSNNQKKKMKDMDQDITRLDKQIIQLREQYNKKRTKLPKIIQKLM